MAQITRFAQLAEQLFVVDLDEEIAPGPILDTSNWSVVGNDSSQLPIDRVLPAEPPDSLSKFYIETGKPTEQQYTATISNLKLPGGSSQFQLQGQFIPKILPAYPDEGILRPYRDGNYHGDRLMVDVTDPSEVDKVVGKDSNNNTFDFTQDPNDPSKWKYETAYIEEPDFDFLVEPVPEQGHSYTSDQLAPHPVPLREPASAPRIENFELRNLTRPGASDYHSTDEILPKLNLKGDNVRGVEIMIARPGDVIDEILPYYPPGANDPNDPNYDPDAPSDGSANPSWFSLPDRPKGRMKPVHPKDPPPGYSQREPFPSSSPWEDRIAYAEEPDLEELWGVEGPSFTPKARGISSEYIELIANVYDKAGNKSTSRHRMEIKQPIEAPMGGKISPSMFIPQTGGVDPGPGEVGIPGVATKKDGKVTLRTLIDSYQSIELLYTEGGVDKSENFTQSQSDPSIWELDLSGINFDSGTGQQLKTTHQDSTTETVEYDLYDFSIGKAPSIELVDENDQVPSTIEFGKEYTLQIAGMDLGKNEYVEVSAIHGEQNIQVIDRFDSTNTLLKESHSSTFLGEHIMQLMGGPESSDRSFVAEYYKNGEREDTSTLPLNSNFEEDANTTGWESFKDHFWNETEAWDEADPPYCIEPNCEPGSGKESLEKFQQGESEGIDCSGFYFQVLDKTLKKSNIQGGNEGVSGAFQASGYDEYNEGYLDYWNWGTDKIIDDRQNAPFTDVADDGSHNPKVSELQVGDAFVTDSGVGHVATISKIEKDQSTGKTWLYVSESTANDLGQEGGVDTKKTYATEQELDDGTRVSELAPSRWHEKNGDDITNSSIRNTKQSRISKELSPSLQVRRPKVLDDKAKESS